MTPKEAPEKGRDRVNKGKLRSTGYTVKSEFEVERWTE